jgi:hypothetical protein
VSKLYLTKALDTVPLEVLQTSAYFWANDNFSYICTLLAQRPAQYRRLIEIAPSEKYCCYTGQCKTEGQIEILLDVAFGDEEKLQAMTDAVLVMIGEPRNGDELDKLYYFYLESLIERKGSDAYIADRLRARKNELTMDQIQALKKIENASHIAIAIDQNLPET